MVFTRNLFLIFVLHFYLTNFIQAQNLPRFSFSISNHFSIVDKDTGFTSQKSGTYGYGAGIRYAFSKKEKEPISVALGLVYHQINWTSYSDNPLIFAVLKNKEINHLLYLPLYIGSSQDKSFYYTLNIAIEAVVGTTSKHFRNDKIDRTNYDSYDFFKSMGVGAGVNVGYNFKIKNWSYFTELYFKAHSLTNGFRIDHDNYYLRTESTPISIGINIGIRI